MASSEKGQMGVVMNHQLAPQIPYKPIKRIMRSAGAGCVSRGAIDIRNAKTSLRYIPPEILDKFEFWEIELLKIIENVEKGVNTISEEGGSKKIGQA